MTKDSKLLLAAMGLMLGFGSVIGYFLAKWDLQSNDIVSSNNAIAATAPDRKPKQINLKLLPQRSELELKYRTCTNTQVTSKALARFDDRQLNDLVFKVCSENS